MLVSLFELTTVDCILIHSLHSDNQCGKIYFVLDISLERTSMVWL